MDANHQSHEVATTTTTTPTPSSQAPPAQRQRSSCCTTRPSSSSSCWKLLVPLLVVAIAVSAVSSFSPIVAARIRHHHAQSWLPPVPPRRAETQPAEAVVYQQRRSGYCTSLAADDEEDYHEEAVQVDDDCRQHQPKPGLIEQQQQQGQQVVTVLSRRSVLQTAAAITTTSACYPSFAANAFSFGRTKKEKDPYSTYVVEPDKLGVATLNPRDTVDAEPYSLSSELCLLKLLPVKNPLFRELEEAVEGISVLRRASSQSSAVDEQAWNTAYAAIETSIVELDKRRGALEPVFNPDDSTILSIQKATRGEQLVEQLRSRLVDLKVQLKGGGGAFLAGGAAAGRNATLTFQAQKQALLALSDVGELLVSAFPYEVPTQGKFSYLPRLNGRAKVTFTLRRNGNLLGNVTIIADGYAAPVTAGNFVDLCLRNFYTGLPIKFTKKRISSATDFEVANLPLLGSYQEGFYDPLTAKLRRIPLELIRVEKSTGVRKLTYLQGLSSPTAGGAPAWTALEPISKKETKKNTTAIKGGGKNNGTKTSSNIAEPVLSFEIPGLVAMNHPEKSPNGASSEFFSLQEDSTAPEKRNLLNGEYAPLGYIVGGYDLFQSLQAGDVIDETIVDEWGALNLVKLRQSSFSEVVQGTEESSGAGGGGASSGEEKDDESKDEEAQKAK